MRKNRKLNASPYGRTSLMDENDHDVHSALLAIEKDPKYLLGLLRIFTTEELLEFKRTFKKSSNKSSAYMSSITVHDIVHSLNKSKLTLAALDAELILYDRFLPQFEDL